MDIINGTDTRNRIILAFTRAEFDDLCEQLAGNCFPTGTAGKILRFRSCFTDEQPEAADKQTELFVKKIPFPYAELQPSPAEQQAEMRAKVRAILDFDGSETPGAVKAMPLVAVSQEYFADLAKLATAARAEHDAEQHRLESAITTTAAGAGLTVVRAEPVEQVAAHPSSITLLRTEINALTPSRELWQAGITRHSPFAGDYLAPGLYADLPLIPDDTLPPGEVHLRPHPRPADPTTS